jgi:two-component system, LytTR family, sensor kinase
MARKTLLFVYVFFFFMYFVGFALMGDTNAGIRYNWKGLLKPLRFSHYLYTILTVVLAHFVVFRKFYYRRPRWKLVLAILSLLLFFILFRYFIEEIIFPAIFGYGNYNPMTTFRYYIVDNVYFGSVIIFIGFVLFLFDELFRTQQQKAALQQQNRQTELNFLQAQMNPHFLFNSLNNIYSLAYEQHPKTAESILKLSDMMRYVTYERANKVEIEKELVYISSMIDVQQLRHDYKLNVCIIATTDALQNQIIPLLILPLVENALKYGDLSEPEIPLTIEITVVRTNIHVTVSNKISLRQNNTFSGVGLKNLQRRLELSYLAGNYFFNTELKDNIFWAKLIIPKS